MTRKRIPTGCSATAHVRFLRILAIMLATLGFFATATVASDSAAAALLTDLSLEDLLNIEITSASKKPQKLAEAAASVYVITQEDIKRSGLTTIPEILRMAPGLQVAHMDASSWAISCRGYNDDYANKLLVLIDGRSVYSPTFSGVFWDVQDYLLEDIDRIEIVRGPGAAMWGANAVNGIINIVTKSASDTQGTFATTLVGGEERLQSSVRLGGNLSPGLDYRVYAKQSDYAAFERASGGEAPDAFKQSRAGFRMDWKPSEKRSVTFQGDTYEGTGSQTVRTLSTESPYWEPVDSPVRVSGGNVLARWTRAFGEDGETALQFYYDRTYREFPTCTEDRDTFDLDYQYRLSASGSHRLQWGFGARLTSADSISSALTQFSPHHSDAIISTFAQDDITLRPDNLRLTLGSKLEHNTFTGYEFQPNARLHYAPAPGRSLWASIARAARTPSEGERDITLFYSGQDVGAGMPAYVYVFGADTFGSEHMTAYEIGYRAQDNQKLTYDVSGFYNHYDDLKTVEMGDPYLELSGAYPYLVLPMTVANLGMGRTYGGEVSATRLMTDHWKLTAGFSYQQSRFYHLPGSNDTTMAEVVEKSSPRTQFSIRSYLDLPSKTQLDLMLYYVDTSFWGSDAVQIDDRVRFDARLKFGLKQGAELIMGGRNLFSTQHLEFSEPTQIVPTQVGPSFYSKLAWSF